MEDKIPSVKNEVIYSERTEKYNDVKASNLFILLKYIISDVNFIYISRRQTVSRPLCGSGS